MLILRDDLTPTITGLRDGKVTWIPAGPDADMWRELYSVPLGCVVEVEAAERDKMCREAEEAAEVTKG